MVMSTKEEFTLNNILSALEHISCAELNHADWIKVGMALKTEGFPVSVWDEWSSKDTARYHPGECERRWRSFHGTSNPVTGASIVQMAMERGWIPFSRRQDAAIGKENAP